MVRKRTSLSSTIKSTSTDPDTIEKLVERIHGPGTIPAPTASESTNHDKRKQSKANSTEKGRGEAPKKPKEPEYDPIVTTSFKLPKSLLKEIKRKAIDDETSVGDYLVSLIDKDLRS
ncbi:MAG: hypothetical protein IPL46_30420 [Saprospiraceae bacterium]|nr:hypothetical protein [Saprospiraceae bacterium]